MSPPFLEVPIDTEHVTEGLLHLSPGHTAALPGCHSVSCNGSQAGLQFEMLLLPQPPLLVGLQACIAIRLSLPEPCALLFPVVAAI